MNEKYFIASDHAGFLMKEKVKKFLKEKKLNFVDLGPKTFDKDDDYNDFAKKLAIEVKKSKNHKGILLCGTGQGVSIQANRFLGIRCALCWNKIVAQQAKEHLNANVIAMPGKYITIATAKNIINTWINTKHLDSERHKRRINKLEKI